MKVAIFGLGYVGVVTAACLSRDGHEIMGVDVSAEKVRAVAAGRSPIIEPQVPELLADGVAAGLISATQDTVAAVAWADVVLVSVGTPSDETGAVDLGQVRGVVGQIAEAAAAARRQLVLVVRSTSPPGTLAELMQDIRTRHRDLTLHAAFNPEFLREGSAVRDFDDPPYTVVGTDDVEAERVVRSLYWSVKGPVYVTPPEIAETIKYAANAWHATKVCFANEIGRIARAHGVDGRDVMEILVEDRKLNISPAYMRPGFAYGGSCLPKDVAALLAIARQRSIEVDLLAALPSSNDQQVAEATRMVLRTGARRVAVLGLAFKPGTDDLRNSPAVSLVKQLLGEGCMVRIYDPAVNEARLVGANLDFIRRHLRHFEELMVADVTTAMEGADAIVIAHATEEMRDAVRGVDGDAPLIDLNGAFVKRQTGEGYVGIAW